MLIIFFIVCMFYRVFFFSICARLLRLSPTHSSISRHSSFGGAVTTHDARLLFLVPGFSRYRKSDSRMRDIIHPLNQRHHVNCTSPIENTPKVPTGVDGKAARPQELPFWFFAVLLYV